MRLIAWCGSGTKQLFLPSCAVLRKCLRGRSVDTIEVQGRQVDVVDMVDDLVTLIESAGVTVESVSRTPSRTVITYRREG